MVGTNQKPNHNSVEFGNMCVERDIVFSYY